MPENKDNANPNTQSLDAGAPPDPQAAATGTGEQPRATRGNALEKPARSRSTRQIEEGDRVGLILSQRDPDGNRLIVGAKVTAVRESGNLDLEATVNGGSLVITNIPEQEEGAALKPDCWVR